MSTLCPPLHRTDLANALSALRLALAPVLLVLAIAGQAPAFLATLIVAFATDAADGWCARRFDAVSPKGARLDSRADLATWLVLPPSVWLLRPDLVEAQLPWIALALAGLAAATLTAYARFGAFPSYHTWGAKTAAIALALAVVAILAGAPAWPLQIAIAIAVVSQIEEVAITAVLPKPETDVRSIVHALRRG